LLRELGVPGQIVVPEPNTWREIVDAVAARPERRIAVQEYGRPNLEMNCALERLGAQVTPFAIYRWELPDDCEPPREAARRVATHVVLFTSSIQLDHLFEIARGLGIEVQVRTTLQKGVAIASVGPVMTATLEAQGFSVDVVPAHPKMAALVKAAAESASAVLSVKRASEGV
jgi:uroporphyrinogen-III synthase